LRRFNAVMRAPIDIYANQHTLEHLNRVYKHIFDKQANVNDSFVATLVPRRVEAGVADGVFWGVVAPVPPVGGEVAAFGGPVGRLSGNGEGPLPLAYCTDVSGIPPESWRLLKGVQTLVLDALRHRKHPTHFTLGEAVSVAHEVGAAQTYFVHMAHDLSHEETN